MMSARQAYDEVATTYDGTHVAPKDVAENNWVSAFLHNEGFLDPGLILDLGSGTGLLLDLIPSLSPVRYFGVDISPRMIEVAQRKHPNFWFYPGDGQDLSSAFPGMVGGVTTLLSLFGVFAYFTEQERAVAGMAAVLKPGGRFVVMTYGPRYPGRGSYILPVRHLSAPVYPLSERRLLGLFSGPQWEDVKVHGLSRWIDVVPGWAVNAVMRLEVPILRRFPRLAYWQIVTGRRTSLAALEPTGRPEPPAIPVGVSEGAAASNGPS